MPNRGFRPCRPLPKRWPANSFELSFSVSTCFGFSRTRSALRLAASSPADCDARPCPLPSAWHGHPSVQLVRSLVHGHVRPMIDPNIESGHHKPSVGNSHSTLASAVASSRPDPATLRRIRANSSPMIQRPQGRSETAVAILEPRMIKRSHQAHGCREIMRSDEDRV